MSQTKEIDQNRVASWIAHLEMLADDLEEHGEEENANFLDFIICDLKVLDAAYKENCTVQFKKGKFDIRTNYL